MIRGATLLRAKKHALFEIPSISPTTDVCLTLQNTRKDPLPLTAPSAVHL